MTWFRVCIGTVACAVLISIPLARGAQTPGALQFEVASVKPVEGGGPPGDVPRNMDPSPGHFAMHNVAFRFALEWAFGLKDYQIAGPDWIKGEERYEIDASAPGPGPASDDDMRLMLRTLLAQRFGMIFHWETRQMPVYALVRGPGAPKVKTAAPGHAPGLVSTDHGVLFQNQPLSRLTFLLSRRMDRPALDRTGLAGHFDYTLDLSGLDPSNSAAPSIFSAISDDLGLKLQARRMPIQVLVIDAINKVPTPN